MHRTLQYAILFIVMVILQIFLFSRIGISVYVHPLVCIAFIVLLPMEIAPLALLGLGLLLGVTLDFFMATAGIHTVAALLAAFCRPALLNVLVGKDEVKDGGVPNVNRIGAKKFVRYASAMILIHSTAFFLLEALSWSFFYRTALRIALSSAVTLPLVYFCQKHHFFRSTVKRSEPWMSLKRVKTPQISVVAVAIVLLLSFHIQVIDDSYKSNAANNVLRYTVQYPPRGEVYDRNGRFLVQSKEAYDLMGHPAGIRPFDSGDGPYTGRQRRSKSARELRKAEQLLAPESLGHFQTATQGGQAALRGARLSGFLHRLPHGALLPDQNGRQPVGLRGRGQRPHPRAQPVLPQRRLHRHERYRAGLRRSASRRKGRQDRNGRRTRYPQRLLCERHLRHAALAGRRDHLHDRRPIAGVRRGADAGQGRQRRRDRARYGRNTGYGQQPHLRSRRTGRTRAGKQLHEAARRPAPAAVQPGRHVVLSARFDVQGRAGPDRIAGRRARPRADLSVSRRIPVRPRHGMPWALLSLDAEERSKTRATLISATCSATSSKTRNTAT